MHVGRIRRVAIQHINPVVELTVLSGQNLTMSKVALYSYLGEIASSVSTVEWAERITIQDRLVSVSLGCSELTADPKL